MVTGSTLIHLLGNFLWLVAVHACLVFTVHKPLEDNRVIIIISPPNISINPSTESNPYCNLTPICCHICRGLQFPFSFPVASTVPGRINQAPRRHLGGSEVVVDPVGLLPDDDSEQSGQVQPASTLQTTNLDWTGQPGE